MAQAIFYKCPTDHNHVHKTLNEPLQASVHFIEPVSIEDPELKLSKQIDFDSYNYVHIPYMNRYYYVTDKPRFDNGFYYVKLHVDVLMSHKSEFLDQEVILKRQSTKYNLYQNDEEFKLMQFEAIRTQEFPNGFQATTQQFILGVVGNVEGGDETNGTN